MERCGKVRQFFRCEERVLKEDRLRFRGQCFGYGPVLEDQRAVLRIDEVDAGKSVFFRMVGAIERDVLGSDEESEELV